MTIGVRKKVLRASTSNFIICPLTLTCLGDFFFRVIGICIELLDNCYIYARICKVCKFLMPVSAFLFPSEFIELSDRQLYISLRKDLSVEYIICVTVLGLFGWKFRSTISGLGYQSCCLPLSWSHLKNKRVKRQD